MTFDEILKEKLAEPLPVKGKPGETVMPIEAMVTAVMGKAIKGDIPSIVFINNMIVKPQEETEEEKLAKQQQLNQVKTEIKSNLTNEGLVVYDEIELENLATQLMVIRRVAAIMGRDNHKDIASQTQKDGTVKLELSTINRIFDDLVKEYRADYKAFRVQLIQQKLQNQK